MIEIIKKWNLYILKNLPILWMSGLPIVISVAIPLLLLGYAVGYFMVDLTFKEVFFLLFIISIICLLAVLAWQYYRFKKELSYRQLVKYYALNILVYFIVIVTSYSPIKGVKSAIENRQASLDSLILNYRTYMFAKGLKKYYDEDRDNFIIWNDKDLIEFNFVSEMPIIRVLNDLSNSPDENIKLKTFFIDINKTLCYINVDDPSGVYATNRIEDSDNILSTSDTDKDGILDIYDWCDQPENQNCLDAANLETKLDSIIENLQEFRNDIQLNYHPEYVNRFLESKIYINKAINLVLADSVKVFYDNYIEQSKYLYPDFYYRMHHVLESSYLNSDKQYIENEIVNISYNYESFTDEDDIKESYMKIMVLFVIINIISSLFLTSRYKIEAMLSLLVTIVPWTILFYILDLYRIDVSNDYFYVIMIAPIILILIYWNINKRITSITWKKSLFLHIANWSSIFSLIIIWALIIISKGLFASRNIDKEVYLTIIFSIGALVLNFLFLYQYHRHLLLPKKSK